MSIHIQQVLDYLDTHLVCQQVDNMGSLMEVLHDAYALHDRNDLPEIRERFRQLREILDQLPAEGQETFFSLVCDLCVEYEQLAFSQGVVVGMLLMTEVNRVP